MVAGNYIDSVLTPVIQTTVNCTVLPKCQNMYYKMMYPHSNENECLNKEQKRNFSCDAKLAIEQLCDTPDDPGLGSELKTASSDFVNSSETLLDSSKIESLTELSSRSVRPRSVNARIGSQRSSRPCSLYSTRSITDVCSSMSHVSGRSSRTSSGFRSKSLSRLSCSSASLLNTVNSTPLPPRDRKILELMIMRHERENEEEELQQEIHHAWQEEKLEMERSKEEEEKLRHKKLVQSRNQFHMERKLKLAMMEQERYNLILEKEQALLMKAQRWDMLAQEQEILRKQLADKRKEKASERRQSQVISLLQSKNKDEQVRILLAQMMEDSMMRAAHRRHLLHNQKRQVILHSNEEETVRNAKKKVEVDQIFKQNLQKLQHILEEKEQITRLNYERILKRRNLFCQQQMEEREEKMFQVHAIQQKLDAEYKEWQQQLVEYRTLVSGAALSRVHHQRSAKREELHHEQMLKIMKHYKQMQKIQNEEKKKLTAMKAKVKFKELKSEMIARKKDQELNQSRATAMASAELRDKLSSTLNPENFSRKVQRVEREARFLSRGLLHNHYRYGDDQVPKLILA